MAFFDRYPYTDGHELNLDWVINKVTSLSDTVRNMLTQLSNKADRATTLSGYGITDAYTKTQTDNLLDTKQAVLGSGNIGDVLTTTGADTIGWQTPTPLTQVQSDWTEADPTDVSYIQNKPTLAAVATSGLYSDLSGTPTIPAAQVQSDWSQADNTQVDYIKNKPTIPAAQVQSDWSQSDNTQVDYIKNKPTIPVGSDYVAKTGDTMTGALTINRAAATQAHLKRNNTGSTATAESRLMIGNDIANGTDGCTHGVIYLYGQQSYSTRLAAADTMTNNRTIKFPNLGGTVALVSQLPTYTTSGDWIYYECGGYYHLYYFKSHSLNFNTAYGTNVSMTASTVDITLPVTITGAKGISVSGLLSNAIVGFSVNALTSNQIKLFAYRFNGTGTSSVGISIHMLGYT